jgi:hypothetical protein
LPAIHLTSSVGTPTIFCQPFQNHVELEHHATASCLEKQHAPLAVLLKQKTAINVHKKHEKITSLLIKKRIDRCMKKMSELLVLKA